MSAYIVDNDTINSILGFCRWHNRDNSPFVWSVRAFQRDLTVSIALGEHGDDWAKVGADLWALNVEAVSQRYPGESPETLPGPVGFGYTYEHSGATCTTPMQAYKSLQCLIYQCSEGDVPERLLYQALVDLKHGIACDLVEAMPEYRRAKWSA